MHLGPATRTGRAVQQPRCGRLRCARRSGRKKEGEKKKVRIMQGMAGIELARPSNCTGKLSHVRSMRNGKSKRLLLRFSVVIIKISSSNFFSISSGRSRLVMPVSGKAERLAMGMAAPFFLLHWHSCTGTFRLCRAGSMHNLSAPP